MDDDASASASAASTSISPPVIISTRSSKKSSGSVAAGSVWESRMKIDEFKGGIKVFNADGGSTALSIASPPSKAAKKRSATITAAATDPSASSINGVSSEKRKTGKLEVVPEGKVQLGSGSTSPVPDSKGKRDRRKPPVPIMRSRSDMISGGSSKESANSSQLRKSKSECVRIEECADRDSGSAELRKVKSEIGDKLPVADGNAAAVEEEEEEEEGGIEGELDNKGVVDDKIVVNESEFSEEEKEEEEEEEELEEEETESEEEMKVSEIKQIVVFEPKRAENQEKQQEQVDEEINRVPVAPGTEPKPMPKQVSTSDDKKEPPPALNQSRIRRNVANPLPPNKHISSNFHTRRSAAYQNYAKSASGELRDSMDKRNKLQNLADLIMWRDASKSTLVFGLGTFTILSSSYTKEINISCISVVSYMGLVYLALIFLYRSLACRGSVADTEEGKYVLGEEEAMWVLRLVLPYLNEFLLKLKALFSGDPATTMKLAVLLFVLARCGSSITIWNLAKFGFFGVFVVPKLCSSYSSHITAYGTFWVRRFRDAWDSCTHKKAVAGAVFTLVWNLCSAVARIWAVFMLYVAFRYYQQHMMKDAELAATEDEYVAVEDRPKVMETSEGKEASS